MTLQEAHALEPGNLDPLKSKYREICNLMRTDIDTDFDFEDSLGRLLNQRVQHIITYNGPRAVALLMNVPKPTPQTSIVPVAYVRRLVETG